MPATKELKVEIGDQRFLIASDDEYLRQLRKGFEPEMVKLFRAVASGSRVVLDVGANIGCTALLFGQLAQSVHAFEPAPSTYAFLEQNVGRSGLRNITLHNYGVGAVAGEFSLTFSPVNRSGGFVSNQTQATEGHIVETIQIRQLDEVVRTLDLAAVDFIKIDVEGFEGDVLRGAKDTLAKFRPNVVMELNHFCLNALQRTSVPEFFDLIRSLFPIAVAVDGASYLDLHNESDRFVVMYNHILKMRFPNILAGFDEARLTQFRSTYRHGYDENSGVKKSRRWKLYLKRMKWW